MDKLENINVLLNTQTTSIDEDITLVECISEVLYDLPNTVNIFEFIDERKTFQKLAQISHNDITRQLVFQLLKQLDSEELSDCSRNDREELSIEVMNYLSQIRTEKFSSLHFCLLTSKFIEEFFDCEQCFTLLEPHFCRKSCDLKTHRILTLIMANFLSTQPIEVKRETIAKVCDFISITSSSLVKIEYLEFIRSVVEEQDIRLKQHVSLKQQPVYMLRDSSSRICFLSKLVQIQNSLTPFTHKSFLRSIKRGYLFDEYGATYNHQRLSASLGYEQMTSQIFDCILFLMNVSAERFTFPIDVHECLSQHLHTLCKYIVDDSLYEKVIHVCIEKMQSDLFPPAFVTILYDCLQTQQRFHIVETAGLLDYLEDEFGGSNRKDTRRTSYAHNVYILPE